jgi:23S rRNA (cytosine1962-C5)-methyltransferase
VLHEDADLLVVHKPPGWNTHAPSPWAGEGLYEWLRDREPRWGRLSIQHRLDKETSGVMVFGLSPEANRSLTAQFSGRQVAKRYVLGTSQTVPQGKFTLRTTIARNGDHYVARPFTPGAELAETDFQVIKQERGITYVQATPHTGRTHQIRVHAAFAGFPILGDVLYGGASAARLWLHSEGLAFRHPADGREVVFEVPADFTRPAWAALRDAVIEPEATDGCRLWHGAADNRGAAEPVYLERLGDYLLVESAVALSEGLKEQLQEVMVRGGARGVYHKTLNRHVRRSAIADVSPRLVLGDPAPESFTFRENGVRFEARFGEGYSVGLFLDQRDNRRRFLANHVSASFGAILDHQAVAPLGQSGNGCAVPQSRLLNLFAYTCGFSVAAAFGGWLTTSLDLSRKYLDWGRRNFTVNGLDPSTHDFIYGDAFEWLRRLARKGRRFEAVVLDPPTFSQSKESGVFRAAHDYGRLLEAALPLVERRGVILASTNAADWDPEAFLDCLQGSIRRGGRSLEKLHYAPQPPDFPVTRGEPPHLKTAWARVG